MDFVSGVMGSFYILLWWSGLYFSIKYYQQLQEQTEQTLKATAAAHQAQLKMLHVAVALVRTCCTTTNGYARKAHFMSTWRRTRDQMCFGLFACMFQCNIPIGSTFQDVSQDSTSNRSVTGNPGGRSSSSL